MKTKTTCTRCGGAGNYSFNLKDGTVCYGCNGSGFQMRDLAKDARAAAKNAKSQAEKLAEQQACIAMTSLIIAELNPVYGPFDVETMLGRDQLNCAVARATGKSLYKIRDERLAAK
jgi:trimethylamine:corrinoid methyltransferase-like protein